MNAATIGALSTAIVAILGAVGALLHSLQTRSQLQGHSNTPHSSNTSPNTGGSQQV
jgi:hypothetical protein